MELLQNLLICIFGVGILAGAMYVLLYLPCYFLHKFIYGMFHKPDITEADNTFKSTEPIRTFRLRSTDIKTQIIAFAKHLRPFLMKAWKMGCASAASFADWCKTTHHKAKPHVIVGGEKSRQWFAELSPRGKNAVMIVSCLFFVSLIGLTVSWMSGGDGSDNDGHQGGGTVVTGSPTPAINPHDAEMQRIREAQEMERLRALTAQANSIENQNVNEQESAERQKTAETWRNIGIAAGAAAAGYELLRLIFGE